MFSSLVRPVTRNLLARSGASNGVRQAHQPAKSGECLMDQLPVPEGPWEAQYKAQNAKYNMQLVAGVAFMAATLAFGELNGFFFAGAKCPELPKKK